MSSVEEEVTEVWGRCVEQLAEYLTPQQISTWIRPLQVQRHEGVFLLSAPNRFVQEWIQEHFLEQIQTTLSELSDGLPVLVSLNVESTSSVGKSFVAQGEPSSTVVQHKSLFPKDGAEPTQADKNYRKAAEAQHHQSNLNPDFTFSTFVQGKSNALAKAAAEQVGQNPGGAYNPFLIYGPVGVGKTHILQALGNSILEKKPNAKVLYLHSERFVADMVRALQTNRMNDFKKYYRSLDALLIDDIQFFAGKERSQEEFFHTFNALLEGQQQVVLTCDRYPKEINDLEERLKSRFGWGLTVAVEAPELETRVAILLSKAELSHVILPQEVAFFVAKRISSNVRELEGALKRVIAYSQFIGKPISLELVKEALKDLLMLQEKLVSIDNIQKTAAEYYKIRISDILSNRRNRSIARPRQFAMALAKELTRNSLPEIGDAFGGRDHTTVLHAIRTVKVLRESQSEYEKDWQNLMRVLTQ